MLKNEYLRDCLAKMVVVYSLTIAKLGLTVRNFLQCVWWDWQEFIYYELLPTAKVLTDRDIDRDTPEAPGAWLVFIIFNTLIDTTLIALIMTTIGNYIY